MGTASTKKVIKQVSGALTEEAALLTSAGAGDADRIPALNASGVLDATIVNSKTTSAGAGDSGKVVALDAAGRIDNSMMPVGIGADTASIQASEALAAGELGRASDVMMAHPLALQLRFQRDFPVKVVNLSGAVFGPVGNSGIPIG